MITSCQRSKYRGFSMIEMLVAMAVLTLMMSFLFNLVAQTIRAWEGGNRQVEAAQAARIGLETMAQDLQLAFGGSATAPPLQPGGATRESIIPFFATNNATARLGLPNALTLAQSSGQVFAIAPVASQANEFHELGYICVFVTAAQGGEGYHHLPGRRYSLLRHAVSATNTGATRGNFFYTDSLPANQTANNEWLTESPSAVDNFFRTTLIPNCYQITLRFASNNNKILNFVDNWSDWQNLPSGILVSAKVMDEKTATRIGQLRPTGLTAADLAADATSDVARILREGTSEVRRFIPLINTRQ
jgi:prepilin-type N-terminal cleavage/methylation domain-containing protein